MASSLPDSLYHAISPYQEGELPYEEYYRMENYTTHSLQEADFLNSETSAPLDLELLQALEGSGFTTMTGFTDMPSFISQSDLSVPASHLLHGCEGSEGTDDTVSDFSEPESVNSECYEQSAFSIMTDEQAYMDYSSSSSGYQTDPELMNCQPMKELIFTHEIVRHENPSQKKKPGRKKGQTSKVLHLWEFIRDLLKDPVSNGKIIQWENHQDGVFKVVKSSQVAFLWGQKKKNKKEMTYEKMSRSMRYSRKEGYFIDLPKNSNYPKKLCFRFGPKSTGWQ